MLGAVVPLLAGLLLYSALREAGQTDSGPALWRLGQRERPGSLFLRGGVIDIATGPNRWDRLGLSPADDKYTLLLI